MNRQQRRAEGRALAPKPTKEAAEAFVGQAFKDRIGWLAARVLLVRVTNDVAWGQLNPELRESIGIFLERHPVADSETSP